MKPNVVIMQHNINDLVILMLRNTYWNFHPDEGPIVYPNTVIWNNPLKQALKRFVPNLYYRLRAIKDKALRRFEDDEFKDVRGTLVYIDKRRIQNEFRMNLQTFINICTVRKIAPVLMTQQNRFKEHLDEVIYNSVRILKSDYGIEYKDYKEAYDLLNETIRKVGKDNNILVIDLANEIPQEKEYIYDPVHLNDTGSKLTAQVINRELKKIINNVKLDWRQ